MSYLRRKVAILGATGAVGQRMVSLLLGHPQFQVEVIAASERSVGKKYRSVCKWIIESEMSSQIEDMVVAGCDVESLESAGNFDFVFSCLPRQVAEDVEEKIAVEYPVFSKASAHRLERDVPLMIPEVNPDHLNLIRVQKENRNRAGFISTDPNCSTIQLAMTLKPLMIFGISRVLVSTMQALSGAGYPGIASLDILDNLIPYIPDEEEKIETETTKVLGDFKGNEVRNATFTISASCCRVGVRDGHTQCVFVELEEKPELTEVKEAFQNFQGMPQLLRLPSAPKHPIVLKEENDRPQPLYDRNVGRGMSVVIGRVRPDPAMTVKYTCVGHNTIRGAAGTAILTAELALAKGYIQ